MKTIDRLKILKASLATEKFTLEASKRAEAAFKNLAGSGPHVWTMTDAVKQKEEMIKNLEEAVKKLEEQLKKEMAAG